MTEETPKVEQSVEQPSIVEKANSVAERIEAANKKAEEILKQQQEFYSKNLLGGRAAAGAIQKTPEETMQEEIKKQVETALKAFK